MKGKMDVHLCDECKKVEESNSEKIRGILKHTPDAFSEGILDDYIMVPYKNMCDLCSQRMLRTVKYIEDNSL